MNSILSKNLFFVKEQVGMFKASNNYDIFDPTTNELILTSREELGFFTKIFRFTDYKRMTPFNIQIKTATGDKVITIRRGVSLFLSKVEVLDENDIVVGRFKQKFFSFGGKFAVLDAQDNQLCMLQGKWTGWDFKFVKDSFEFAQVSKEWAGLGRELFTSADNYVLKVSNDVAADDPIRMLILGAVMCIDMVLKE